MLHIDLLWPAKANEEAYHSAVGQLFKEEYQRYNYEILIAKLGLSSQTLSSFESEPWKSVNVGFLDYTVDHTHSTVGSKTFSLQFGR